MNKATVSLDSVYAMFDELDQRNRRRVFRTTLNRATNIVIREARKELRKHVKNTRTKNKWNGRTMEWGIRKKVHRNNEGATIHIMGDFRLKFFEMGTVQRFTKKGKSGRAYRGAIPAYHFFQNTVRRVEQPVFNEVSQLLSQQVRKINAKYQNK